MNTNKQIDIFIFNAQEFAQPILNHIRALIHATCPEVEETLKWGFPHFMYKNQALCYMASFKKHCTFGFPKASLMKDKSLLEMAETESAMGHFGKITSIKDLPSDKKIIGYVKDAMKLNDAGIKVKKKKSDTPKELIIPDYFTKELQRNKAALKTFQLFSPSCKREYIDWIVDAKTETTREKRMSQAIEWMSEGKKRNWKYEKC